jgi:SOS-response transcriptional repressor LexA
MIERFTAMAWPVAEKNIKAMFREIHQEFLKRKIVTVSINGDTKIDHGFGAIPEGWQIVDTQSYEPIKRVTWDANSITLTAANPVTATIMIMKR